MPSNATGPPPDQIPAKIPAVHLDPAPPDRIQAVGLEETRRIAVGQVGGVFGIRRVLGEVVGIGVITVQARAEVAHPDMAMTVLING